MAILPDKILTDLEISKFIDRVNNTSKEIVGESKFVIPDPSLPGIGLLIKLEIRTLEKSLASSFAPIFIGKRIIDEARKSPARFFSIIEEGITSISTLFRNPIQFLLDEGINNQLKEFPFPISVLFNKSFNADLIRKLRDLIDSSQPEVDLDSLNDEFKYSISFSNLESPGQGQANTVFQNLETLKSIRINYETQVGGTAPLQLLKPGDTISLTDGESNASYSVSSVKINPEFADLELSLLSIDSPLSENKNVLIPGFANATLSFNSRINLREFLTPSGSILIPLAALGINLPLLNGLSFEIGNINDFEPESPIRKYIESLEKKSGLRFGEVLFNINKGIFPKIDFGILNRDQENGTESKEKSREELVNLVRFLEIGTKNPFFLLKIIGNYLKLLLLPIQLVIGVLKGLADKFTNPLDLIKNVIIGLTNPLKLVCDLIATSILEFLRPFIEPSITPILPYQEAVVDPLDKNRGLKPLISDLICGKFQKDFNSYVPNSSFFENKSRDIQSQQGPSANIDLPFDLIPDQNVPAPGQLVLNSQVPSSVTSLKISTTTNTVEDISSVLTAVEIGSSINLSFNESYNSYTVSSKFFRYDPNGNYFEYFVQPQIQINNSTAGPITNQSPDSLRALLNVNNPNKITLFIIERYLPLKLIAIWDSLKGILGIIIALALQIPSLLLAVIRSLFGINQEGNESEASITSIRDLLLTLSDGNESLLATSVFGEDEAKQDSINLVNQIIGNNNDASNPGIEQSLLDLSSQLLSEGKIPAITKNSLDSNQQSIFIRNVITVNNLAKSVKVLAYLYDSVSELGTSNNRNIDKDRQTGPIYFVNDGNVEIVANGEIYKTFLDFRLINKEPTNSKNNFNLNSFRNLVLENLVFAANVLLPSLQKTK
jgi:hypothetical protein